MQNYISYTSRFVFAVGFKNCCNTIQADVASAYELFLGHVGHHQQNCCIQKTAYMFTKYLSLVFKNYTINNINSKFQNKF